MENSPTHLATILLVEDDEFVRDVTFEILAKCGFVAVKARNASEAIEVYRQSSAKIDLVLSDVVMPGKSGHELGAELRLFDPRLKIVLMSGYGDTPPEDSPLNGEDTFYLPKPFSVGTLVAKLKEALGLNTKALAARAN